MLLFLQGGFFNGYVQFEHWRDDQRQLDDIRLLGSLPSSFGVPLPIKTLHGKVYGCPISGLVLEALDHSRHISYIRGGSQFIMKLLRKLPRFLKNKYVLTVLAFLLWLLFFDNNDLIRQYERHQRLNELKEQRSFYKERIERTKEELKALTSDTSELERFARERYLMKKPNEDIYVIVDEEEEGKEGENLLENQ